MIDHTTAQAEPAPRPNEYPIPINGRQATCRSCGAAMIWTRTERGAAMPLSVASIAIRDGRRYALPHWIDCPNRDQHRRRRSDGGQPLEIKQNHETQQEFLGCSGWRESGCKHTEPLSEHIRLRRAGQRGLFDEEESHAKDS